MLDVAAGLAGRGLAAGETVALFAEGSGRWLTVDQGIMMNGAADAVRRPPARLPLP